MIHLALQTEFSFKNCFMHISEIHKYVVDGRVGVADLNNTFGHIPLKREAEKHGFTPIYGVRLNTLPDESKQRRANYPWIYIAKNDKGLQELYGLVSKAYDQFYYIPKLNYSDLDNISDNILIIQPFESGLGIADCTAVGQGYENSKKATDSLMIDNNRFPTRDGEGVYQLLAGARKNGDGYSHNFSDTTYDQHIMSEEEWLAEYEDVMAVKMTHRLGTELNADIPEAEMVTWSGDKDIEAACRKHQSKCPWSDMYEERLMYELGLIIDKDYVDYFMITADLIMHCKKTMLVGPARGSSAGSLVCYLLGITEVDPVEHNLIFERFIDINRFDLPDIDIDFPDTKRDKAIKYLGHKYGREQVRCLANINRLKAKSAIGEFAKSLEIPAYETTAVKDAIIERSSGDARAAMCIADTFETTDAGKEFIEQHPKMALVSDIEGHASHAGKHAAGILVSTAPLNTYGSLNSRDEIVMMDKKDAEYLGLLKIDCLGLRNLSILEAVAEQIGIPSQAFYTLPLDDAKTYELFNSMRLNGVFQFEGQALQMVVKQMGVKDFNDISAITALARPGALNSGGTARYIKYSLGEEEPTFYSDVHKDITGDTYGIVVYQEQMMEIARRVGGLSWADTSDLRRAASKSMGDEFFGKYKDKFVEGALEGGYPADACEQLWTDISASGSWSFNKSHAVSYALISYWTAYCKANHPMEFAVASLNHSSSDESAVKLLRDFVVNEDMKYTPLDPDLSEMYWSAHDGVLVGGLLNLKGIGPAKAKKILSAREGKTNLTPALYKAMSNPVTAFDIIFPAQHYWGFLYNDPKSHGLDTRPITINQIDGRGEYVFIGRIIDRNLRDLNEHVFLSKRNGELVEDNNLYLNFKLEDDTDMISCKIGRFQYDAIGKEIAESGKIGHDWYLVRGKITGDWRRIDVKEIVNLNKYYSDKITIL